MPAKLKVLTSGEPARQPSRKLGQHSAQLWEAVTGAYHITDVGGIELLTLACQALDRKESLRTLIDEQGKIVETQHGPKDHPALRHELAARAFVAKIITRLGLDVEPIRQPSRPTGPSIIGRA